MRSTDRHIELFIPLLSLGYQTPVMAELRPLVATALAVWDTVTQTQRQTEQVEGEEEVVNPNLRY